MHEINRNTSQFIYLDIYGGTADDTPEAAVTHNGDTPVPLNVVPGTSGTNFEQWEAVIPLSMTQEVGELRVVWSFTMNGGQAATKIDYFDVIVPVISIDELRENLDLDDFTDDQLRRAERQVRHIIEQYTGQEFYPTTETIMVKSRGDLTLQLPKRLISATSIYNTRTGYPLYGWETRGDGWQLVRTFDYLYDETPVTVIGPIVNPYAPLYNWPHANEYRIAGRWGWERVPSEVAEAATILIEQRLCNQSSYRDMYLSSMKAADWRFDISPSAYTGTGNVVADQILARFMTSGVVVF